MTVSKLLKAGFLLATAFGAYGECFRFKPVSAENAGECICCAKSFFFSFAKRSCRVDAGLFRSLTSRRLTYDYGVCTDPPADEKHILALRRGYSRFSKHIYPTTHCGADATFGCRLVAR